MDKLVGKIPVEWEETLGDAVLSALQVEKDPDPKSNIVAYGYTLSINAI